MATSLNGRISTVLALVFTGDPTLGDSSHSISDTYRHTFTDGTGLDQVDRIYTEQRTLTASATTTLDLAGSLADPFGATITFARIKAILVFAATANTNNVIMGATGANQFVGPFGDASDSISTKPGGTTVLIAPDATGWPVTAGTGDNLKFANSAGSTSVTYDLVILGASA